MNAPDRPDKRAATMSLDNSLKTKGNLSGKRNVLTRPERIKKLVEDKKLDLKKDRALGLPKTRTD